MKQLCYLANVQPIEDISALRVKRLVEYAVTLDSIYGSAQLIPVSLCVKVQGGVVLAKLIRARWVIIGTSDNVSNELAIWESKSCSSVHLLSELGTLWMGRSLMVWLKMMARMYA